MASRFETQLKTLPAKPGVYLFRDKAGRRPLRGQGQVPAPSRPVVLSAEPGHAHDHPAAARASRGHRGDRHPERGRGAAPRAEPRQAPPAALQRPAQGRQVVPLHSGHGGGRIPARDVHARAPPSRSRLLRAVRQREEGPRDPRRAESGLSVPALRGPEARTPLGHSLSRLPHRPLPGALRRLRVEGRLPRDHRPGDRVPVRKHQADPARAGAEDAGSRRGRAVRGGRALSQPAAERAAPGRTAGRRSPLGRNDRRDRARGRGRSRRRAGLPAPRTGR